MIHNLTTPTKGRKASIFSQFPFSLDRNKNSIGERPSNFQTSVSKRGTLRLDHNAYAQPDNDLPGIVPLHLNENLFAAGKTAVNPKQLTSYLENLHRYPTNGTRQLQQAIADHWQINPDKIVIGNGSANLLRDLVYYLLGENDTLLLPDPGWSFYHTTANLVGANIETFPLLDLGDTFVYDRQVIAAHIDIYQPEVVLICSPNNPTGNVMPIADFLSLVRAYPQVNFTLDEAYYGFRESYSAAQEQALLDSTEQRNLFVVRTFSKFYGLANLRLGFVICEAMDAHNLQKIAPVFGLPSLNQALAAHRLADVDYQEEVQLEYAIVNAAMAAALQQIPGMTPYKTGSNFILVRHDARWADLDEKLLSLGYKIKRETINGSSNYLRITYADLQTMSNFINVIRQFVVRETAVA